MIFYVFFSLSLSLYYIYIYIFIYMYTHTVSYFLNTSGIKKKKWTISATVLSYSKKTKKQTGYGLYSVDQATVGWKDTKIRKLLLVMNATPIVPNHLNMSGSFKEKCWEE